MEADVGACAIYLATFPVLLTLYWPPRHCTGRGGGGDGLSVDCCLVIFT